jgi:hypothetical protein
MSLARKVIAVENHANSGLSHHIAPLMREEDETECRLCIYATIFLGKSQKVSTFASRQK